MKKARCENACELTFGRCLVVSDCMSFKCNAEGWSNDAHNPITSPQGRKNDAWQIILINTANWFINTSLFNQHFTFRLECAEEDAKDEPSSQTTETSLQLNCFISQDVSVLSWSVRVAFIRPVYAFFVANSCNRSCIKFK